MVPVPQAPAPQVLAVLLAKRGRDNTDGRKETSGRFILCVHRSLKVTRYRYCENCLDEPAFTTDVALF